MDAGPPEQLHQPLHDLGNPAACAVLRALPAATNVNDKEATVPLDISEADRLQVQACGKCSHTHSMYTSHTFCQVA